MKKIAIVTLFGTINYGNRLQNYAVKKIFENEGYYVDTLNFKKSRIKEATKRIRTEVLCFLGQARFVRESSFIKFNKNFINERKIYSSDELIPNTISNEYDFFVTGSDQVWNPQIRVNQKNNFFLLFCRREQRIAISPSIGVPKIPDSFLEEYERGLKGFRYLSCREKEGCEEISRICKQECFHLIDPTLMITRNEWLDFSTKRSCPEKYVVLFFLGNIDNEIRKRINEYARSHSFEIIEINSTSSEYYGCSPNEFIYILSKAKMIFTDSFHATAFSINLHVPFIVFERQQGNQITENIMSRLTSLLRLFEMEDKHYSVNCVFDGNYDFTKSDTILSVERKRFSDYLYNCLNQN